MKSYSIMYTSGPGETTDDNDSVGKNLSCGILIIVVQKCRKRHIYLRRVSNNTVSSHSTADAL